MFIHSNLTLSVQWKMLNLLPNCLSSFLKVSIITIDVRFESMHHFLVVSAFEALRELKKLILGSRSNDFILCRDVGNILIAIIQSSSSH